MANVRTLIDEFAGSLYYFCRESHFRTYPLIRLAMNLTESSKDEELKKWLNECYNGESDPRGNKFFDEYIKEEDDLETYGDSKDIISDIKDKIEKAKKEIEKLRELADKYGFYLDNC